MLGFALKASAKSAVLATFHRKAEEPDFSDDDMESAFRLAPVLSKLFSVIEDSSALSRVPSAPNEDWTTKLSHRQVQVANLVVGGLSNGDIAEKLGISENTVVNHLTTIYRTLQIRGRFELMSMQLNDDVLKGRNTLTNPASNAG